MTEKCVTIPENELVTLVHDRTELAAMLSNLIAMWKYEEKLKEMEKQFQILLAKEKADFLFKLDMVLQVSSDGALMAADDVFEITEDQAKDFHEAHVKYVNKMAHMAVVEDKDDPQMWWTKDTIDNRLRKIVGEKNFVPWDERMTRKEVKDGR